MGAGRVDARMTDPPKPPRVDVVGPTRAEDDPYRSSMPPPKETDLWSDPSAARDLQIEINRACNRCELPAEPEER